VRVLCTCLPGYGHVHPMVPLARALRDAGHQVAFATEERFCRRVEQAGLRAFPAGIGPGQVLARTLASAGAGPPDDPASFGARMFAGVAAPAKVGDLVRTMDSWPTDLVIHDATDFAGPVAAAHAGVPAVAHSLGPMFPLALYALGAEIVSATWEAWGVTPGPFGGMFGAAYLDICPPALQSPELAGTGADVLPLRPVAFDAVAGEVLPSWVDELPPLPTVYVTLGTVDNGAPGVMEAAIAGLRDEPLNVVVTVGPDRDPAELGPQPAGVHVERYVPQSALLPRCSAVVSHGGSGTMLATLAHALPLVLLPQGANQFANTDRCVAAGVGVRLLPEEVDPVAIRDAVRAVLDEPDYREQARAVAVEIDRMPAPADLVGPLEEIADGSGPRR
jgi:UDP:flavonoid glycosyltransferase YjiC (YdhE family)